MKNPSQQLEKARHDSDHKPGVHSICWHKRRFYARRRGFSLVELLVAISIIGLLVGIGTAAGLKMNAEARKEQTRAMMEALLSANDEYKAVRQGSSISHTGPAAGLSSTEQFIASSLQIKTCEEIVMAALNSSSSDALDRIYTDNPKTTMRNNYKSVYDRWGTEIEYRQSNNQTGTVTNSNGDTINNSDLPLSRDPFFASAGPDKTWGTDDDITTIEP